MRASRGTYCIYAEINTKQQQTEDETEKKSERIVKKCRLKDHEMSLVKGVSLCVFQVVVSSQI